MLLTAFLPAIALALDGVFGEPQRAHPLVWFGHKINQLEKLLRSESASVIENFFSGALSVVMLIAPAVAVAFFLSHLPWVGNVFSLLILYLCLGLQSLHEHARAVAVSLQAGDLITAREKVSWIVSRDTQTMDETQITRATIESVLENGNDAVFATLFWFFLLGAPGAVLLRTANTLDAMWGYKTEKYLHFGRCAAKLDDVLNWMPARLTAITFALLGHTKCALHCWKTQARFCSSPNGGLVMTAGAGSLQMTLGGGAMYHGQWQEKIIMGEGSQPVAKDIERALALVRHGAWCWVCVFALLLLIRYCFYA